MKLQQPMTHQTCFILIYTLVSLIPNPGCMKKHGIINMCVAKILKKGTVVQPTTRASLGVYGSRHPLARYVCRSGYL